MIVNINADLGEGTGVENEIMPMLTSCSVACGGHAGDLDSMNSTVEIALKHKVKIFGFHFASLDIRQDSRIHKQVFDEIFSHPKIRDYVEGIPENFSQLDA